MQLTYGEPPTSKGFDPEAEGYARMREPSPSVLSYTGSALGIPMAAVLGWILWPVVPPLRAAPLAILLDTKSNDGLIFALALLGMTALTLPIHELIHFAMFPAGHERGIGVWPRKVLFYAYCTGPMNRGRVIAALAMPFLVLSVLPSVLLLATGTQSVWLFGAIVLHTAFCGGDAVFMYLLLARVPRGAVVRNQGYATYFREALG